VVAGISRSSTVRLHAHILTKISFQILRQHGKPTRDIRMTLLELIERRTYEVGEVDPMSKIT
jgi:hypothetical protein